MGLDRERWQPAARLPHGQRCESFDASGHFLEVSYKPHLAKLLLGMLIGSVFSFSFFFSS